MHLSRYFFIFLCVSGPPSCAGESTEVQQKFPSCSYLGVHLWFGGGVGTRISCHPGYPETWASSSAPASVSHWEEGNKINSAPAFKPSTWKWLHSFVKAKCIAWWTSVGLGCTVLPRVQRGESERPANDHQLDITCRDTRIFNIYIDNFHVILNATVIQCVWYLGSASPAVLCGPHSLLVLTGSLHFANNQRAHLMDVPPSNVFFFSIKCIDGCVSVFCLLLQRMVQ